MNRRNFFRATIATAAAAIAAPLVTILKPKAKVSTKAYRLPIRYDQRSRLGFNGIPPNVVRTEGPMPTKEVVPRFIEQTKRRMA